MNSFLARLGTQGEEKRSILIPKELHKDIEKLLGKQVKVIIENI